MAKARIEFQTFLDGLCSIYRLDKNRRPTLLLGNVRFQRRVVGAKRHWTAEQAGHNIEMVIRLPRADFITGGAFVVIGGKSPHARVAWIETVSSALFRPLPNVIARKVWRR